MSDELTIPMLRGRGFVKISKILSEGAPTISPTQLRQIAVADLKRICDFWGIPCGGKKSADIRNLIQAHIDPAESNVKAGPNLELAEANVELVSPAKSSKAYKKSYGQFNTTHPKYIFSGMAPKLEHTRVIDPCAGNGDLIRHALALLGDVVPDCFDIDPTKTAIATRMGEIECKVRDTLADPIDYRGSFLIMNPPYLSNVQNKDNKIKKLYLKYKTDDLFKCYIHTMLSAPPAEFMIIIPLNFLCSIRAADCHLRGLFFGMFDVYLINVFNEQVFSDTTYTVCSIHGVHRKKQSADAHLIRTIVYPEKAEITIQFSAAEKYLIGGEIYQLKKSSTHTIGRAVGRDVANVSNIYLKAIDDGSDEKSAKLGVSIAEHPKSKMFGKISDRSYCWITITPMIPIKLQENIVKEFNARMSEWRTKYNSLFLTNFRDKGRKRISFELAFRIISNLELAAAGPATDPDPADPADPADSDSDADPADPVDPDLMQSGSESGSIPEIFTKKSRNRIIGSNIRANICEKWQMDQLNRILPGKIKAAGTNVRVNHITYEIRAVPKGLFDRLDFADWSEDFDIQTRIKNFDVFFNLKFICEAGGQQNRSIKPVAHMIYCLAKHIETHACEDKKFVFITDGEYIMKFANPVGEAKLSQLHYQVSRVNEAYQKYFFIGSTKQFIEAYPTWI